MFLFQVSFQPSHLFGVDSKSTTADLQNACAWIREKIDPLGNNGQKKDIYGILGQLESHAKKTGDLSYAKKNASAIVELLNSLSSALLAYSQTSQGKGVLDRLHTPSGDRFGASRTFGDVFAPLSGNFMALSLDAAREYSQNRDLGISMKNIWLSENVDQYNQKIKQKQQENSAEIERIDRENRTFASDNTKVVRTNNDGSIFTSGQRSDITQLAEENRSLENQLLAVVPKKTQYGVSISGPGYNNTPNVEEMNVVYASSLPKVKGGIPEWLYYVPFVGSVFTLSDGIMLMMEGDVGKGIFISAVGLASLALDVSLVGAPVTKLALTGASREIVLRSWGEAIANGLEKGVIKVEGGKLVIAAGEREVTQGISKFSIEGGKLLVTDVAGDEVKVAFNKNFVKGVSRIQEKVAELNLKGASEVEIKTVQGGYALQVAANTSSGWKSAVERYVAKTIESETQSTSSGIGKLATKSRVGEQELNNVAKVFTGTRFVPETYTVDGVRYTLTEANVGKVSYKVLEFENQAGKQVYRIRSSDATKILKAIESNDWEQATKLMTKIEINPTESIIRKGKKTISRWFTKEKAVISEEQQAGTSLAEKTVGTTKDFWKDYVIGRVPDGGFKAFSKKSWKEFDYFILSREGAEKFFTLTHRGPMLAKAIGTGTDVLLMVPRVGGDLSIDATMITLGGVKKTVETLGKPVVEGMQRAWSRFTVGTSKEVLAGYLAWREGSEVIALSQGAGGTGQAFLGLFYPDRLSTDSKTAQVSFDRQSNSIVLDWSGSQKLDGVQKEIQEKQAEIDRIDEQIGPRGKLTMGYYAVDAHDEWSDVQKQDEKAKIQKKIESLGNDKADLVRELDALKNELTPRYHVYIDNKLFNESSREEKTKNVSVQYLQQNAENKFQQAYPDIFAGGEITNVKSANNAWKTAVKTKTRAEFIATLKADRDAMLRIENLKEEAKKLNEIIDFCEKLEMPVQVPVYGISSTKIKIPNDIKTLPLGDKKHTISIVPLDVNGNEKREWGVLEMSLKRDGNSIVWDNGKVDLTEPPGAPGIEESSLEGKIGAETIIELKGVPVGTQVRYDNETRRNRNEPPFNGVLTVGNDSKISLPAENKAGTYQYAIYKMDGVLVGNVAVEVKGETAQALTITPPAESLQGKPFTVKTDAKDTKFKVVSGPITVGKTNSNGNLTISVNADAPAGEQVCTIESDDKKYTATFTLNVTKAQRMQKNQPVGKPKKDI